MKVGASHTPSLTTLPLTSPRHRRRSVGEEGLLQAAALVPVVETGESEDVETRVRPHCDGTGLDRAQIWRSGTHSRKQCEIWAQFQPNPVYGIVSLRPLNLSDFAPSRAVRSR